MYWIPPYGKKMLWTGPILGHGAAEDWRALIKAAGEKATQGVKEQFQFIGHKEWTERTAQVVDDTKRRSSKSVTSLMTFCRGCRTYWADVGWIYDQPGDRTKPQRPVH